MSDTITLTSLIRDYQDGNQVGWGIEFEWLRQNHASEILKLLHLVKRDGIKTPILLGKDGRVWDGHHRIYVATLLGIRDIPVEFM